METMESMGKGCCPLIPEEEYNRPITGLAMCYVPWQHWRNLYDLRDVMKNGTIFKDLTLPFRGRRCE